MIIEIHDVWRDAAATHERFFSTSVNAALEAELARVRRQSLALRTVHAFVVQHWDTLASANTIDFSAVVNDYVTRFPPNSTLRKQGVKILKKIFDYDAFRNDRDGWGAYSLCSLARYQVCPYCHIRTTETVLRGAENAGYRPQLDHFYDRARYPFLALSLGNLVPCCGTCNGPGMKHTKDFFVRPHLNPLRDASVLSFALNPANGAAWTPLHQALRVPAEQFEVLITAPTGNARAANSLQTFQLRMQYRGKVREAYRIAKLGLSPAFSRAAAAATGLDVHEMTIEDHLGFNPVGDDYKTQAEGKMRRDIYLQSRTW